MPLYDHDSPLDLKRAGGRSVGLFGRYGRACRNDSRQRHCSVDNVAITAGSGTTIATDDVSSVHYQRVKLVDGTLDSTAAIPGDATNGLYVNVKALVALPTGSNAIGKLAANSGVTIGDVNVISISAGTNLVGDVDVAPRTTGGWSVANFTSGDTYTALTNSAQVIKASAGKFGGYYIYNPNTVVSYVCVYNIAAASVTVGTSTALLVFAIPPTAAANIEILAGIPFGTAMSCAAATTGGGNGAPTTALEAMIYYK